MGTYMGNVGNLMQHWTLCEILAAAQPHCSGLNYIDAHAMAPWATRCAGPDGEFREPNDIFQSVKDNLHRQGSHYEQAWGLLWDREGPDGYPSSAAFVRQIWGPHGPYSMLLCETNLDTINEIDGWIRRGAEALYPGNWRHRFAQGLPKPGSVGLQDDSLTLVSFDPHSCSKRLRINRPNPNREIVYLEDLMLTQRVLYSVKGTVIIQLSTYGTNGGNSQGAVISSVNSVLFRGGFALVAVVRVDGLINDVAGLCAKRSVGR